MNIQNKVAKSNLEVEPEFFLDEEIYFRISKEWYKGRVPAFYDTSKLNFTSILEDNFSVIKEEVLSVYKSSLDEFEPMYVPSKYKDSNWTVFNFYGFMFKHPDNLRKVPKLAKILEQVPDLVTAQVSILKPGTKIKAHISGSNALIRSHLPIVVPGSYPELGFRVKQEERGWEEGKVLSFSESNRHYSWNYSNQDRIVLLIDTIHPSYSDKKVFLSASSLSVLVLKMFANKFPVTKRMPKPVVRIMLLFSNNVFYFLLFLQNKFGFYLFNMLQRVKF